MLNLVFVLVFTWFSGVFATVACVNFLDGRSELWMPALASAVSGGMAILEFFSAHTRLDEMVGKARGEE